MTLLGRSMRYPVASLAAQSAPLPPRIPFVQQLRAYLGAESAQPGRPYCVAVMLQQQALCWLDATHNRMLFAEPSAHTSITLQTLLRDPQAPLLLTPLARDAFEQKAAAERTVPIGPTLWSLGLDAIPEGIPLPPLHAATRLKLRRWPDFRVLGHRHDDFRICALMIKQGVDVSTCCAVLGVHGHDVQAFFNAAYLSGYAFTTNDTALALRRSSHSGLAGLWRQVRARWSA